MNSLLYISKMLWYILYWWWCCAVAKSCLTHCDAMDCSTPSFPVLHYLPELAQTHVDWVGDAIQPSHPLSLPSPPIFSLSQHQTHFLMSQPFASGGQSIGASVSTLVLLMNVQCWFPLGLNVGEWVSNQIQCENENPDALKQESFQ